MFPLYFLAIIPSGILVTLAVFRIASGRLLHGNNKSPHDKRPVGKVILVSAGSIGFFFVFGAHPYFDAPMNLSVSNTNPGDSQPTYYSGVYGASSYFSAKGVEVHMKFSGQPSQRQPQIIQKSGFLLAGIGVQSPNCCKDGLDYGYRADILFSRDNGRYLVARAWQTCDQNIACSGVPWESIMYQNLVPLSPDITNLTVGMKWNSSNGQKMVQWYYSEADVDPAARQAGTDKYHLFGSFATPDIENPIFDVGVLNMTSLQTLTNPPFGNANFYQAGIAEGNGVGSQTTSAGNSTRSTITFGCLTYISLNGSKNCSPDVRPIVDGDSHWKVLWRWGLPLHQSDSYIR